MKETQQLIAEIRNYLDTAERELAKAQTWEGASKQQTQAVRTAYRFAVWKMSNQIRSTAGKISQQMRQEGI